MNLIDCHTHTQFSMDSEADIIQMIERAKELNLSAYAVTDHCECSTWYPKEHYHNTELFDYFNYKDDFEASVSALTELKKKYSGFNLICGIEMGQPLADIDIAEKIASDPRLDFIIASLHQIDGEKDFYYINYYHMTTKEINNLLERYFNGIYKMCRWGKFDILGHLTYCLRYMKIRNSITPNLKIFDEIIAESLRTLAQNGKGIEINTSGIRQGFGTTFPSLKYIRLFKELGGEIISIGSDAHKVSDIGANISDGISLAKLAGFDKICYFRKHQPNFIKI
ncbi:MAG: histidinol-phosphatase HisJ family protein [Ruminococcus sp.]|nr:histidinol-phosphatase HisJ family protein [Ruminococcus sp.]